MKYINYLFPTLFIFYAFFLPLTSTSQVTSKGYEIRFKPQNGSEKFLYLVGMYGNNTYVVDSAKFAKKQYLFKNTKSDLKAGFYTIQSQNGAIKVDFLVDLTHKFSIEETETTHVFINSEENTAYQQFKKDLWEGNDLNPFYYTSPESLLGKYVLAQYIPVRIPEFFWGESGREGAARMYHQYVKNNYFNNVDFKDVRLMRTPLEIDLRVFFMEMLFPQTADNMMSSIDNLLQRIVDENPIQEQLEVRDFYLKKLVHIFMNTESKYDTVFVYLVDNYVSKLTNSTIISGSEISVFKRMADRMRKTFVGRTIPVFESYTKDQRKISTADMPSTYVLLWFWDPDCDHCLEYTPALYDFYCNYHTVYDFDVIACSVTEDYDRWEAFINQHHLDWFNTSYVIAQPNYDAIEYFNFNDTPAIYIIDKQHKIVARQFHIDELFEIFESFQD